MAKSNRNNVMLGLFRIVRETGQGIETGFAVLDDHPRPVFPVLFSPSCSPLACVPEEAVSEVAGEAGRGGFISFLYPAVGAESVQCAYKFRHFGRRADGQAVPAVFTGHAPADPDVIVFHALLIAVEIAADPVQEEIGVAWYIVQTQPLKRAG